MPTPLAILRSRADEALTAFSSSSGFNPEEVWEAMVGAKDSAPEFLAEHLLGAALWDRFETLRNAEISTLKKLRP
jgi:hypothetical protein